MKCESKRYFFIFHLSVSGFFFSLPPSLSFSSSQYLFSLSLSFSLPLSLFMSPLSFSLPVSTPFFFLPLFLSLPPSLFLSLHHFSLSLSPFFVLNHLLPVPRTRSLASTVTWTRSDAASVPPGPSIIQQINIINKY